MENENNLEDNSIIKKTEKKLYSSGFTDLERKRSRLSGVNFDTKQGWGEVGGGNMEVYNENMLRNKKTKSPLLISFFILSILFLFGSIIFASFLYLGGTNVISPDNVDISVLGPVSVKGGEDFNLQVMISNKNNTSLESADLLITYPVGSRINGVESSDGRYRESLGIIEPNQVVNKTIKSAVFGEENSDKEIKVSIEYRNENSNAILEKDKSFMTLISSSPLSLFVDAPDEVNSNQDISFNLKVTSNSSETINGGILSATYPSGFLFKSAVPMPTSGEDIWELGNIKKGTEKIIKIKGVIQGQDEEVKSFRISAGIDSGSGTVGVPLASALKSITIKKPFIGVNLTLNGSDESVFVASSQQQIRGDVEWTNNLPVKMLNGIMTVKITGDAFDKNSVNTEGGFFRSSDNTIIWDTGKGGIPYAAEAGENGRINFSFASLPLISGNKTIFKNPEINIELKFKGIRFAEGNEQGALLETTVIKKVRLSSSLQVAQRLLYKSGPFKNTGPLPPVHDSETSYTIVWSLVNSSNDISDATVKANLPTYVKWLGQVYPEDESVSYNPLGGEVIWNVGNIKAGSGINNPSREVSFQVSLLPSLTQVGTYPVMISDALASGKDDFTSANVSYSRKSITAQLGGDSLVTGAEMGSIK